MFSVACAAGGTRRVAVEVAPGVRTGYLDGTSRDRLDEYSRTRSQTTTVLEVPRRKDSERG
jgi:hypothetical protein